MKLGYVIIYVKDVMATIGFYEKAFGLKRGFVHESSEYGEMITGDTKLGFASEAVRDMNGVKATDNRVSKTPAGAEIAFVTSDVQKAFDKAVKAGAKGYKKPALKPWGQTVAYVRDCNGFLVEICTPVEHA